MITDPKSLSTQSPATPMFRLRAGRALVLGVLAMAAVAWIVTLSGIVGALVAGVPFALLTQKFARLRAPLITTLGAAFAGAFAGALAFGNGAVVIRLVAGVIAGAATAPWCVVLAFVLWTRARAPNGTP